MTDQPTGQIFREHARTQMLAEVFLQFGNREEFAGTTANLSPGGMFVVTSKPRPVGSLLRFEVQFESLGASVMGYGEVVWIRVRDQGAGRDAGMGIQFRHIEADGPDVLNRAIAESGALEEPAGEVTATGPVAAATKSTVKVTAFDQVVPRSNPDETPPETTEPAEPAADVEEEGRADSASLDDDLTETPTPTPTQTPTPVASAFDDGETATGVEAPDLDGTVGDQTATDVRFGDDTATDVRAADETLDVEVEDSDPATEPGLVVDEELETPSDGGTVQPLRDSTDSGEGESVWLDELREELKDELGEGAAPAAAAAAAETGPEAPLTFEEASRAEPSEVDSIFGVDSDDDASSAEDKHRVGGPPWPGQQASAAPRRRMALGTLLSVALLALLALFAFRERHRIADWVTGSPAPVSDQRAPAGEGTAGSDTEGQEESPGASEEEGESAEPDRGSSDDGATGTEEGATDESEDSADPAPTAAGADSTSEGEDTAADTPPSSDRSTADRSTPPARTTAPEPPPSAAARDRGASTGERSAPSPAPPAADPPSNRTGSAGRTGGSGAPPQSVSSGPGAVMGGIQTRTTAGTTAVSMFFDKPMPRARVRWSRQYDPPRILLRMVGVDKPYRPAITQVGSPEVTRIRTGFQADRTPSELHVVIDLASDDLNLTYIQANSREVEVRIGKKSP